MDRCGCERLDEKPSLSKGTQPLLECLLKNITSGIEYLKALFTLKRELIEDKITPLDDSHYSYFRHSILSYAINHLSFTVYDVIRHIINYNFGCQVAKNELTALVNDELDNVVELRAYR